MKKSFPYTVSLTKEVAAKWHSRARDAKVSRSAYLSQLIEEDYAKPKRRLVMMDETMYEEFQKLQGRSKPEKRQ